MKVRALRLAAAAVLGASLAASAGQQPGQERIAWLWDGSRLPAWSGGHAAVLLHQVHVSGEDRVLRRAALAMPALPAHTLVTPVVHVELSTLHPARLGVNARAAILDAMHGAAARSTSGWVQLDMEARPSHREAYVALVRQLRSELPAGVRLSVTALAWWCRTHWLDDLAADEIVPMVFRMGRDSDELRALWATKEKLHPRCRQGAVGIATVEPLPAASTAAYRRVYIFDPRGWRRKEEIE